MSVYLDYQATTPLAPEVFAAMEPWLRDHFANPHSAHREGRRAAAAIDHARDAVAALMPAGGRVVFTASATEAINLGLRGAWRMARQGNGAPARDGIVTIATEHAAVLDCVAALASEGARVTVLPVDGDGLVDSDAAAAAIDARTAIVAAMLVNNEIGVIQPLGPLSAAARAAGAMFLCDAVQGYGRVPVPSDADMVAVSAHKIYGPKGVGALWLRDGVRIAPLIHGGGQEGGLRSGTLSPALCAGFGAAAELMRTRGEADRADAEAIRDAVFASGALTGWMVNGASAARWPGNLNIRHARLDAARLMSELRDIAFALGSACASGSGRSSHVLAALGLDRAAVRGSIRLGWGRYSRPDAVVAAIERIAAAADAQLM